MCRCSQQTRHALTNRNHQHSAFLGLLSQRATPAASLTTVMAAAVHDTLAAGKAALGIDDRDLDPDARGAEAALFLAHVLCDFEAVGERRS